MTIEPTTPALAWHGSADLKAEVVERMRKHRDADEIVQGYFQEIDPALASGYRGCAIGCTLPVQNAMHPDRVGRGGGSSAFSPDRGWHETVEAEYGIPAVIGHFIDHTFEGIPYSDCAAFAVEVIEAIPVAADLSTVAAALLHDVLADAGWGVPR